MKYIINRIKQFYWCCIASPVAYARHIGVNIGENCLINTRYWSSEPYLITIGNHVQVTTKTFFHTHGGGNSVRLNHPNFDVFGKIVIEDWAYIGAQSHIMPGVTIGTGALVAAGSIVTKSVPPHTVVGGNPAKVICTTDEYYEKNKKFDLETAGLSYEEKKSILLSLDDEKFIKK